MNQPPDPDRDLQALFARQRRADHADAPAWRDEYLRSPARRTAPQHRWLPVALGIACLVLAALVWMPPVQPQPNLSEALPPLFDAAPGGLFAHLGPSFTVLESPSDFLLPDRLHSNLNLHHHP